MDAAHSKRIGFARGARHVLHGIAEHPWVVFVEQPPGFRGELSATGFIELVQVIVITTPTGALRVQATEGAGTLWFEGGSIVHAAFENDRGAIAFQRMLKWRSGSFSIDVSARAPERSIDWSTTQLLLESARVLDEQSAGGLRGRDAERAAE
jgi:hypothetical protein